MDQEGRRQRAVSGTYLPPRTPPPPLQLKYYSLHTVYICIHPSSVADLFYFDLDPDQGKVDPDQTLDPAPTFKSKKNSKLFS